MKSIDQPMQGFNILFVLSWAKMCIEYNQQKNDLSSNVYIETSRLWRSKFLSIPNREKYLTSLYIMVLHLLQSKRL